MDELERYLEERTAAADELERARMEERDSLYTMDHRNARMPRLPHDLDLDRDRVEGVGLLDPRTLMEDNERKLRASTAPPSTLEFLDETREPKYMEPTENERVRDAMRVREREKHRSKHSEYPRRLVFSAEEWERKKRDAEDRLRELGRVMTPGQRDLEERVIAGMRRKQAYLRNPRHPEVPSALDGTERKRVGAAIDPTDVFVVEPDIVEFHQFELGETYEMRLTIRNKSALSRRLRILPPPSRHFSITELKYPSDHGLLAPGNAAYATVRFKPDSLADYEDFVTVITETSKFRVECSARRHPPCLTLDQSLDVGYVLVGNDVETRMPFKNVGGEGRFRLVDEADWPEHTTPLTLPNEDAMLSRGELKDPEPVPCIGVAPFRIGPGYMELAPLDVEQLRIGFAPPGPGSFMQQFRMVCDNSQVQTFTVTGRGTVLDVGLTEIDARATIPGELTQGPVYFGKVVPGSVNTRTFTVKNATMVPVPFVWEHPREGGIFAVDPPLGVFEPDSVNAFTVTFSPNDLTPYEADVRLVVDTSVPARVPHPEHPFAKPVLIEDFSVFGVGAERHCTIDTNLVNYAGSLLPGRHYDREVTVVNHSDAAAPFRWVGHDPDAGLLVYPHEGILEPNGGCVTCVVELTPRQVQRFDAQMSCVVEHGPTLPLRITAEVEGPEVAIAQSQVDFGLLQQHVAGDTYLLIRNQSAIAATWALEERRPQSVDGAPAPRSEIVFSVAEGELPPYAEVEVECTLVPSAPGPYRSNIVCVAGGGRVSVVAARADVLQPLCALSTAEVDLGTCYVNVPVEREIVVQNMTMLPAVFRWSPEPEGESEECADSMDFDVDWREDEIPPGGSKAVRFIFTPLRPCARYEALVAMDVDGAAKPLGFALTADVRGLSVEYEVLRGLNGEPVAGDASHVADSSVLDDHVRVDFGDSCEVREHAAMEVLIKNTTAIETSVRIDVERHGVPDAVGMRVMECWAAARGADAAGLSKGGVARRGAKSVGGCAGGDGIVAHTMGRATVMEAASYTSTVFGAASTSGPDALRSSLQPHEPATHEHRGGTYEHLGGIKAVSMKHGGAAFARSLRGLTQPSLLRGGSLPTIAEKRGGKKSGASVPRTRSDAPVTLSAEHEKVSFSRGLGVQMHATRSAHEADAEALKSGDGVAFVVYPSSGILPPYGEFRAIVTVVSDMPGEYFDALRCRVGDMPERRLPVRAGITGSPLVVQPVRYSPMGYDAYGPKGPKRFAGLDWGSVRVGAPGSTKRFFCVNYGPKDMVVEFQPWLDPDPKNPKDADVPAALATLNLDEIGGRVGVDIVGKGRMCQRVGPFKLVPAPAGPGLVTVPKRGGCVGFEVEYRYSGTRAKRFVGSVVGTQRVADHEAVEPELTLELGCAKTKLRVGGVDGDGDEVEAAMANAEAKPISVSIGGAIAPGRAQPPKPMKPLVVRLTADAYHPRLKADQNDSFNWTCYAHRHVSHSSYFRTVTLTNTSAEAAATFRMKLVAPFSVVEIESSVPQLAFGRGRVMTRAGISPDASEEKSVITLPPRENVQVTMRFTPPDPDVDDAGHVYRDDYEKDAALVVLYDNGDVQNFPVTAKYIHPELKASKAELDFGRVHPRAAKELKALRVTLTNDTPTDAEWTATIVGPGAHAFECVPPDGVVKGKGPTGLAQSTDVEIFMSPDGEGEFSANADFGVRVGRGCGISLRGEGTYAEEEEGGKMPRFDPVEAPISLVAEAE